jgi:hypothetical protein
MPFRWPRICSETVMSSNGDQKAGDEGRVGPLDVLLASDLKQLVEIYWIASTELRSQLEDLQGCDGRLEYLLGLRVKFAVVLHELQSLMDGEHSFSEFHVLAEILERGVSAVGLDSNGVHQLLLSGAIDRADQIDAECQRLIGIGEQIIASLPGEIPSSMGQTGQRQMIRAMRNWSALAEHAGEDLGFLEKRLSWLV